MCKCNYSPCRFSLLTDVDFIRYLLELILILTFWSIEWVLMVFIVHTIFVFLWLFQNCSGYCWRLVHLNLDIESLASSFFFLTFKKIYYSWGVWLTSQRSMQLSILGFWVQVSRMERLLKIFKKDKNKNYYSYLCRQLAGISCRRIHVSVFKKSWRKHV